VVPRSGDAAILRVRAHAILVEAAERGDGAAACHLGDLYREGQGSLARCPDQARRWYARSALAGDADGQNNLGACFQHGLGGTQSYRQAVYWYRRAAIAGLACAASNLAHCHLRGHGVPKDETIALHWFEAALEQAHPHAEEWVARLRASGIPAAGLKQAEPSLPRHTNPNFWDVTEDVMRHGIAILIGDR